MGDASDIGKRATLSDHSGCDGSFAIPGPDGPIADNAPPNLSTRGARASASAAVRGGYCCFASDGGSGGAGGVTGWRGGNEAEATVGERERAIQSFKEVVRPVSESVVVRRCRFGGGSSVAVSSADCVT